MLEGILNKSGKGWKINYEKKEKPKELTVSGDYGLTNDMDGKPVQFDSTGGSLQKIVFQKEEYKKQNTQSMPKKYKDRNQGHQQGQVNNPKPARAPYNFIPLNKQVVPSNGKADHSQYDGLSGHIDLNIETKTALFLRGHDEGFFRLGDTPYLPGSSLRGLCRSLLEIMSYSKLTIFDDKLLYRRSNLTEDGNQVFGGFLTFENGVYKITTAQYQQIQSNNIRFPHSYMFTNGNCTFSVGTFGNNLVKWSFTFIENGEVFEVPKNLIKSYVHDDTRSDSVVDLIKSLRKGMVVDKLENKIGDVSIHENRIPVFYRKNGNEVISFGHAKYHRMPYPYSIAKHFNQNNTKGVDLVKSIFGTDKISGKVFFEDALLSNNPKWDCDEPKTPKILSSPKPTSYNLYLEQPNGINTNQMKQENWSDEKTPVRGYKNYWHKNGQNWQEIDEGTNSHSNPIQPISPNSTFIGRIRFDNLTQVELGALLFAIDLPEGCGHKLGMGKPLGLGSIRISTLLTLIDRKKRYEKVFDEDGKWNTGECVRCDLNEYKDNFAKYIGENTKQTKIKKWTDYWEQDERMRELKHILTLDHSSFTNPDWEKRTRYMEIQHEINGNEYKNRPVLPKPSEVVKSETYT